MRCSAMLPQVIGYGQLYSRTSLQGLISVHVWALNNQETSRTMNSPLKTCFWPFTPTAVERAQRHHSHIVQPYMANKKHT